MFLLVITDQGEQIVFSLPLLHISDDSLVAGQFDIPAQQSIGRPQKRMEPVDGEEAERKSFYQVVLSGEMGVFMCDHMGERLPVHMKRNVDSGGSQTEKEGGSRKFTLPDIIPEQYGGAHLSAQAQVAENHMTEHQKDAGKPEDDSAACQNVERFGAGSPRR